MTAAHWRFNGPRGMECENAPGDVVLPRYSPVSDDGGRSASASRTRPHGRGVHANRRAARARAEPLRAGRLLAALVGALRLQALGAAAQAAALGRRARAAGAGRERRRARPRRRTRRRVQGRVHNHPSQSSRSRARPPGVGGILRDIIAMGARPIALLDGLRFGAPDAHFRRAVAGIGALRELESGWRRWAARRSSTGVRGQLPRQRDVRRAAPVERVMSAKAKRAGQRSSSSTAPPPAATASAARRCSRGRSSARATRTSGRPFRSAIRSRATSSSRSSRRARRAGARRVPAGLRRGRARVGALRDGARRDGRRRAARPRAAPRARSGALGDHDLGEPGAHGCGRRARAAGRGRGAVSTAGSCTAR